MLYDEAGIAIFPLPDNSTRIYKTWADQKEGIYPVWSLARRRVKITIPEGIITW